MIFFFFYQYFSFSPLFVLKYLFIDDGKTHKEKLSKFFSFFPSFIECGGCWLKVNKYKNVRTRQAQPTRNMGEVYSKDVTTIVDVSTCKFVIYLWAVSSVVYHIWTRAEDLQLWNTHWLPSLREHERRLEFPSPYYR